MAQRMIFGSISLLLVLGLVASEEENTFKCQGTFCKSVPSDCNSINCQLGVRFEMLNTNDPTINVHAGATAPDPNNYVAIGFSKDGQMGNDAVIMCIPDNNIQTMVNPPENHSPPMAKEFISEAPTGKTLYKKGRVDCSFILPVKIDAGNGVSFDLRVDTVNVFVVTGKLDGNKVPQHHDRKVMGLMMASELGFVPSKENKTTTTGPAPPPSQGSGTAQNAKINFVILSSFLAAAFAKCVLP